MALTLYKNNDQIVTLTGVVDAFGNVITGATITGTIVDKTLNPVGSAITFTGVSGAPGNYIGAIPYTFPATIGTGYILQVTGTSSGIQFYFEVACSVVVRAL